MRNRPSFLTVLSFVLLACGSPEDGLAAGSAALLADDPGAATAAAPTGWREERSGIDSFAAAVTFDGRLGLLLYAGGARLYASWDRGDRWFGREQSQNQIPFYPVVSDPNRAGRVYAMRGSDSFVSENAGLSWQQRASGPRVLAVAPGSSTTLWGSSGCSLQKSLDRGESWSALTLPVTSCVQSVVAVSASNVYVATSDRVLHSRDGGVTWPIVSDAGLLGIDGLAVDRRTPEVVYAAYGFEGTPARAGLRKSTDGGLTWSAPGARFAEDGANSVSVSPVDGRVYVTAYAGDVPRLRIEVSVDGGATFAVADRGLTDQDLNGPVVPSPTQACVAAIATNAGVFRTFDGGGSCP